MPGDKHGRRTSHNPRSMKYEFWYASAVLLAGFLGLMVSVAYVHESYGIILAGITALISLSLFFIGFFWFLGAKMPYEKAEGPLKTIGDDAMPPRELHLSDEWLDELNVVHDGERYGFVVENGELRLERAEND